MAVTYTGENQSTEGAGSKFAGVRSDTGSATSEFVAIAAGARETVNGKVQAPMRTQVDSTAGMGAQLGTVDQTAATSDTGSFSLISLTKRLLQHLSTAIDWLEAIGATDDAAVITNDNGTLSSKLRGLVAMVGTLLGDSETTSLGVGETTDVAVEGDTGGSLNAKARGLNKVLGATGDSAVSSGTGSISAKLRGALDWLAALGATTDTAVVTDANGTINGHLRGIVVHLVAALTHLTAIRVQLPATLGRKAAADSLASVMSSEDFAAIGATNETAATSDTATAGLNGRLQRIAQNQTTNAFRGATPAYATPVSVTTSATLIKAATSSRKKILVKSSSGSVSRMYLGADNSVTAGPSGKNFEYLDPGDTWEDENYTGAVYGICDTGGSASAKYLEVTT